MILDRALPIATDVRCLDLDGKQIDSAQTMTLLQSGAYTGDYLVDEDGAIKAFQIRKKTAADDEFMAEVNRRLNEGPSVAIREIDCNKLSSILADVHDKDQGIRNGTYEYDPEIDQANLEIVVSILEQCDTSSGGDISGDDLFTVWIVIQHGNPKYRKKYISFFEDAANAGDLQMSSVALMKDRIEGDEGRPQIYGSQVLNDELYDLLEPEYVDQRRAEVGLGPLSEYLENFGIEFTVEQKTK